MNTIDLLEAVKVRRGVSSDYALAKVLGVTQQAVSSYRSGNSKISDDVALTVAEILHLEPMHVIALANAERAKTEAQKARWLDIVEKFSVPFKSLLSHWDGRERRHQGRLHA
ncbi:MAG: helix-turn-helix domain-containing protein [Xanthobacteraceae bacterium]